MTKKLNQNQKILSQFIQLQRVFNDNYLPPLIDLLQQRKEALANLDAQYPKFNMLTQCVIVLFFTFVENSAISIKHILMDGCKSNALNIKSKNQMDILMKNDERLTFDDVMKITFSVFPTAFGMTDHYGNIKGKELSALFLLRDIRNRIIHPKGIEDFFVSLKSLNGQDVNSPMVSYITELQKVLNACNKNITIGST